MEQLFSYTSADLIDIFDYYLQSKMYIQLVFNFANCFMVADYIIQHTI